MTEGPAGDEPWYDGMELEPASLPATAFLLGVPWLGAPTDPEQCPAGEFLAAL